MLTDEEMGESSAAKFMLGLIPNSSPYDEEKALMRYVAKAETKLEKAETIVGITIELVDTSFRKLAAEIMDSESQRQYRCQQMNDNLAQR